MSKFNLTNKIKGVLKSKNSEQFKVNSEFDNRLLNVIQKKKSRQSAKERPSYFDGLAQLISGIFNRYALVTATIVLVAFGGTWYYNQNSYTYHLNKAKSALNRLEVAIDIQSNQITFIPVALAEDESDAVDEELVTDLAEEVVEETEASIEVAEEMSDSGKVQQALKEIGGVQEQEIEVLAEAVMAVASEKATQSIAEALRVTVEERILVGDAANFVSGVVKSGGEEVNIDIETSGDTDKSEKSDGEGKSFNKVRAEEVINETRIMFEELASSGVDEEDVEKIAKKIEYIEKAIEDEKYGRAYGLSTAAKAQGKHIMRKGRRARSEEEHSGSDDEITDRGRRTLRPGSDDD